jgi:hypothetical protein
MSVIAVFGNVGAVPQADPPRERQAAGDPLPPDLVPGGRPGGEDPSPTNPDRGRPGKGDPMPPPARPDPGLPGSLDPVPPRSLSPGSGDPLPPPSWGPGVAAMARAQAQPSSGSPTTCPGNRRGWWNAFQCL